MESKLELFLKGVEKVGFFEEDGEESEFSGLISDFRGLSQYGITPSFVIGISKEEAKKIVEEVGANVYLVNLDKKYVVKLDNTGKEEFRVNDDAPYDINLVYSLSKHRLDKNYLEEVKSMYI